MKQYLIVLVSLLSLSNAYSKPIEVRVAAYDFPPYFAADTKQHIVGDITKALNAMQADFHFSIAHIAPNGRYDALSEQGCCDVILFEDESWGWQNDLGYPVVLTSVLHVDHERFVALKALNRNQSFFQMKGLRFGGIIGYHYAFAGNEKDNRVLEEEYGIYLGHSQQVNLHMLLNGRIDLIMLADAYIRSTLSAPLRQQLLFDETPYGTHNLAAVVNPNKALSAQQLEQFLQELKANGDLARIFANYDL